jgi:NSS family neurotransmitter:Na+ symporter
VLAGWIIYFAGLFVSDLGSALSTGAIASGAFAGQDQESVAGLLGELHGNSTMMIAMHALFMAVTIFVVARGVHGGIEKVAIWLMPTFFILFLGITIYSVATGAFGPTLNFLFAFEPVRLLDPNVMLSALGQALFSLSLGSALMITYGAYASRETNLAKTSGVIASADTSVAISCIAGSISQLGRSSVQGKPHHYCCPVGRRDLFDRHMVVFLLQQPSRALSA